MMHVYSWTRIFSTRRPPSPTIKPPTKLAIDSTTDSLEIDGLDDKELAKHCLLLLFPQSPDLIESIQGDDEQLLSTMYGYIYERTRGSRMGLSVVRENMQNIFTSISSPEEDLPSVKNFVERMSAGDSGQEARERILERYTSWVTQALEYEFATIRSTKLHCGRYELPDSAYRLGLVWSALSFFTVPGVGLFYSGLVRRRNALTMLWLSLAAIAVTSFQWFLFGYSLTFSHETNGFIGNHHHFILMGVTGLPSEASTRVPDILLFLFYGNFESFAAALAIGAVAERGSILPSVIFMFIWSSVIYNPIAYWTWNPNSWIFLMGGLDFSGGTPVHITSGCTALAYSYMLGKRRGHGTQELNYRPHNVTHIAMGTVFLWVGWFGFTAGSALGANIRAVMAFLVTNLAACAGGITWSLVDYRLERKWSVVGFCSGLVAITPGSGFVPPWAAIIFGIVAGAVCNYATKLKYALRADDALDIFAVHAIGGFTGNILTAFFAADYIAHLDGFTKIDGGWLNHHWIQLGYQLADSVSGGVYSFFLSCIILALLDFLSIYFPFLKLRASQEEEILGTDDVEIGEFAYDYVELSRDAWALDDRDSLDDLDDGSAPSASGCYAPGHYKSCQC